MEEIEEMNDPKPSLFVETLSHEVKILSNFELLKMQIMSNAQSVPQSKIRLEFFVVVVVLAIYNQWSGARTGCYMTEARPTLIADDLYVWS